MLKTLKPRISTTLGTRVQPAPDPTVTPRLLGRRAVDRRKRWLRSQPMCVACSEHGLVVLADEVDHITPLWSGGAENDTNLQSLCRQCHAAKTAAEAKQAGMRRWG